MNLAVMGAGYVGLTTAICLASQNHRITIFDIDNEKIKQIQNKKLPFFENGLQEILEDVISSKNLVAVNSLHQLVENTDGCFICVGTPTKDDSIDLTQIIDAAESLANSVNENNKKNSESTS